MADQAPNDLTAQPAGETASVAAPPKPAAAQISPTPLPRKPKQDRPPEGDPGIWRLSRRNLLTLAGWMGFFGFIIASTVGSLRFMFPRVLFEPPMKFKAGSPAEFTIGEVSERFKDEQRVWIVREREGFYALISICTHLGCTPRWLPSDNKFKCPCHGSGFYKSGMNFEGPAPRPLERAYVGIADDGQLEVDRSMKFLYEKNEWGKPGSFLSYTG
ncbi:MAG TPA: Rieske 2Fe-2S domain-containing protein [Bacteroidota bacterium]